jgi:hypothetical protein
MPLNFIIKTAPHDNVSFYCRKKVKKAKKNQQNLWLLQSDATWTNNWNTYPANFILREKGKKWTEKGNSCLFILLPSCVKYTSCVFEVKYVYGNVMRNYTCTNVYVSVCEHTHKNVKIENLWMRINGLEKWTETWLFNVRIPFFAFLFFVPYIMRFELELCAIIKDSVLPNNVQKLSQLELCSILHACVFKWNKLI